MLKAEFFKLTFDVCYQYRLSSPGVSCDPVERRLVLLALVQLGRGVPPILVVLALVYPLARAVEFVVMILVLIVRTEERTY